MKSFLVRLVYLLVGLFLFALGIVITIKANIGYAPWEVLHAGLAQVSGISIGLMSIIAGIVVVAIVTAFGEKLGFGSIMSMILTGVFIDLIMILNIFPIAESLVISLIMLVVGLFIISLGTYFYIKSAFGAGPRDNLMVVLNRKTRLPVGVCRSIVELTVTFAGWYLGGMIGIGTVISVVLIGFCIQLTFAIFKFDPASVQHETLKQTFDFIFKRTNDELLRK
ncbi:MAG: hypothetical protein FWH57_04065 [Oscillospiraceae bacterium]|nr:hypothetical protein [Oscillospiraceae bacterium]